MGDNSDEKREDPFLDHTLPGGEDLYRSFVQAPQVGMGIIDAEETFLFSNPAADEIFGLGLGELRGRNLKEFLDEDQSEAVEYQTTYRKQGGTNTYELDIRMPDGRPRTILVTATPWLGKDNAFKGAIGIFTDITGRKVAEQQRLEIEQQLRHTHRMESIGRLSAGIAHEFNNLLSPILMAAELAMMDLPAGSPLRGDMEQIRESALRAKDLAQQLLSFGRRHALDVKVIDLNDVVSESLAMIERLIREDIEIRTDLSPGIGNVKADPVGIQQVLINLAIRARDAMPLGGRLDIETHPIEIDVTLSRKLPMAKIGSSWVCLSMRDSGGAMDSFTAARIFEPIFDDDQKASGPGLYTVHGIIRQHGGSISVESAPGRGTEFRIYLPTVGDLPEWRPTPIPAAPVRVDGKTVLIAEDEAPLRRQVRRTLETFGLHVIEARDGEQAIERAREFQGEIHLLLSDVVMPRINGKELYGRLCQDRPELKVVFMSGHLDPGLEPDPRTGVGPGFIRKPFSVDTLMREIRSALDR